MSSENYTPAFVECYWTSGHKPNG